ncbi:hypothetical protein C0993_003954 [Termitomyces sp. T159_Od127]|nr:hypothetical protein C0993_003954 [Termitomyces sp. T159_Od127]
MNKNTTAPIVLPFGPKPGWELEEGAENDKEGKRSISESCVLIQALRQSRDKWLYSTFPRFSSKVRGGKTADPAPPPHTIQTRGKCDLEIGPHVFSDTTFYEVHYLPSQPSSTVGLASQTPKANQPSTLPATGVKSPEIARSSGPLASNVTSVATITPALINQVNSAASSNPTLANLLQLAAAGLATPDQLKTLGLLIQSLANSEVVQPVPPSLSDTPVIPQLPAVTPSPVTTPPFAPVKEFDLVLEFRESPNERWVFPRGLVTCERTADLPATTALCRAVIRTCLPFSKTAESEPVSVSGQAGSLVSPTVMEPQVATFTLERMPLALWDTISRWAGNQEKLQHNKMKLDAIQPVEHVFLGYQLSEGPLMTQLQTVSAPAYTMKSLKSASSTLTRAKRKAASRPKVTTQKISQSPDDTDPVGKPPPTKRKRVAHNIDRPTALPIQCVSCKNQDVPLILGGRFCRPCVEAGHATTPTPSVQLSRHSSSNLPPSIPLIPPSTTETTSSLDTPK